MVAELVADPTKFDRHSIFEFDSPQEDCSDIKSQSSWLIRVFQQSSTASRIQELEERYHADLEFHEFDNGELTAVLTVPNDLTISHVDDAAAEVQYSLQPHYMHEPAKLPIQVVVFQECEL